jgi:hypothetical protein
MLFSILLAIAFIAISVSAYTGVDLSVATNLTDWQCLVKDHSVTYTIIRAYRNVGLVDSNSPNSLKTALSAGVKDLSIYMFPCMPTSPYSISHQVSCPSAEQQVLDTVNLMKENNIRIKRSLSDENDETDGSVVVNRIWLDIEDESPSLYYDADVTKNQAFIASIVAEIEKLKIPVGIYTTKTYWTNIMGNILGYGKYPLWYPRYDGVATLDFFAPFADWTEVKIKQTAGDSGFCGIKQVDTDYREVESI